MAGGQAVWGFGFTFINGAQQAWISDEVGEQTAAPIYLRATQFALGGALLGIPVGAAIAALDLQLPMVAAAIGFWDLALLLLWTMAEVGYAPTRDVDRSAGLVWRTFRQGLRTGRGRSTLIVILLVAVLLGAASEAFDRLWPLHLLDNIGLIGAGLAIGGSLLTGLARRATDLDDPRRVVRALLVLIGLLAIASRTLRWRMLSGWRSQRSGWRTGSGERWIR